MRPVDAARPLLLAVALILLVVPSAGFGYMTGPTTETVAPGGTATFTVYIAAEDAVTATVQDSPADWTVDATPDTVTATTDAGARYVSTGDGYTKVVPVETAVTVPATASAGSYGITTSFTQSGGGDADDGAALAVSQVEDVSFTITVEDGYTPPSTGGSGTSGSGGGGASGGSSGGGGGGGGGGFFQQARDALGMGEDTGKDAGEEPDRSEEDTESNRKLIPSDNETGKEQDAEEPADDGGRTGATGLLTGIPSSAVLAFELLWIVVIGYLLYRRR